MADDKRDQLQPPTLSDLDTRDGAPSVLLSRWFLDNCVTTTEEWANTPDVLHLRDDLPWGKQDESSDDENRAGPGLYEIPSVLFRQLQGLVRLPSAEDGTGPEADETVNAGTKFTKNIIRLQPSMNTACESTAPFLRSVVRHFAKTVGAHLITLTRDDLEDLAQHASLLRESKKPDDDSEEDQDDSSSDSSSDTSSYVSSDLSETDYGDYLDLLFERKYGAYVPRDPRQPPHRIWELPRKQHRHPKRETPSQDAADKGPAREDDAKPTAPKISDKRKHCPLVDLLAAPYAKGAPASYDVPLIVHLFVDRKDLNEWLRQDLKLAVLHCPIKRAILFIISTEPDRDGPAVRDRPFRRTWAPFPGVERLTMRVGPVRSESQEALMLADGRRELRARNIRVLQRAIRKKAMTGQTLDILKPYSDWAFLDGSLTNSIISKDSLHDRPVYTLLHMLGTNVYSEQHIKESILGMGIVDKSNDAWEATPGPPPAPTPPMAGRPPFPPGARQGVPWAPPGWTGPPAHPPVMPGSNRPMAPPVLTSIHGTKYLSLSYRLDPRYAGCPKDEKSLPGPPACEQSNSWANFPPAARKVLESFATMPPGISKEHYWERQLLCRVVDPKDLKEDWADIAIQPDTESVARDVVRRHSHAGKAGSSYGILQHTHSGSALIYGPSGTGKSQLARLMARESGSTVISVSPEDLEGRGREDSLRLIRALLNLGKMLSPSVVLLNMANGAWGIVNHLVTELNDFARSATAPLLLIATSLPDDLEPATLRRIPVRMHMGLPSAELRARIFEIALRDEVLDPEIDYVQLALMTPRFSGSDIRNLCIQAAVMCDAEENGGKRILGRDLFERALKRVSPTVNKGAVDELRKFAVDYDPLALKSMEPWDDCNEEGSESSDSGSELQMDTFVNVPPFK